MKLEQSHASRVPNGRVVGSIQVVRIRKTAASVLRWTVPRVDEPACLRIPAADSLWEIVLFCDPKHALRVDGHAHWVRHTLLVVGA